MQTKTKTLYAWKVVLFRPGNDGMTSIYSFHCRKHTYTRNDWSLSYKDYPFFCLDSKEAANDYKRLLSDSWFDSTFQVIKCEVDEFVPMPKWFTGESLLPKGTVYAKSIKPL